MGFKNLAAFKKRMKKRLDTNPKENTKRAVARSVMVVRQEAVSSILGGAKSGRTYVKYNPSRTHTASAAGQAPASDTGTLASGITTKIEIEKNAVVGKIIAFASDGGGDNYAKHLEFGTSDMSARPFMQPALNKSSRKIIQIFKQEGVIE